MIEPCIRILGVLALVIAAGCGGAQPAVEAPKAAPAKSAAPATQSRSNMPLPKVGELKMNAQATDAYNQGITAYANGDMPGARQAFERAIGADPDSHQAHYSLGVVLERVGDSGAASEYRQSFSRKSDYEPAIIAYAVLLAKRGNFAEAESFLTQQRARFANSAGLLACLAEIKSLERDTASAQKYAQEALKKDSDYRPAMVTIARDHYRNRRLDLALYALQAILDGFGEDNPPRDKDNAEAHFLRGIILKEEGRRAASIKELREAVRLRPDLVSARVELGTYFLEAGNTAEAQPQLEWALRYDATNVAARLSLGDCYRLTGRIAEAKREFEWVLLKESSLFQAHYDLGLLYLFASSIPGMDAKRQADQAVVEIQKYQQMRGRLPQGQSDDSDELLNRAKQKQADIQAQGSAKDALPAPAGAASSAAGSNAATSGQSAAGSNAATSGQSAAGSQGPLPASTTGTPGATPRAAGGAPIGTAQGGAAAQTSGTKAGTAVPAGTK